MKPVSLKIKAFGAFLQEQTIDFRKLSQSPLFLVHGATGAGKTTIFDAMCFALYGETTGSRKDIRSDFATENDNTEVEFIFQMREQYYRVKRSLIPKKKKTKTEQGNPEQSEEEVNEKQTLYLGTWDRQKDCFVEGGAKPITQKTELKEEVFKILGFDARQFKQIVVLPQGNFQEFLRAKSKDKSELLSQLFNASIYKAITEKLKEEAKKQKEAIEKVQRDIELRLKALGFSSMDELQPQITALNNRLQAIENELPALTTKKEEATKTFNLAKVIDEDFKEWQKTANAYEEHLSKKDTHEANKQKLDLHSKAEPIKPLWDKQKDLKEKINQENNNLKTNQALLTRLETALKENEEKLNQNKETWESEIKELELKINKLQEIEPLLEKLDNLNAKFQQISQEKTNVEQEIKKIDEEIKTHKQTIKRNNEVEIPQNQRLSDKLSGWEKELENLEKLQPIHENLIQKRNEFKSTQQKRKETEQQVQIAYQAFEQKNNERILAESNWLASQAVLLAQQLQEGEPCPVCGSTHHPNKAVGNGLTVVTKEQLEQIRQEAKEAEEAYGQKKTDFQKLKDKEEELLESGKTYNQQLGEWANLTEEQFKQKLKQIEQERENAQKAKENIEKLQQENQKLDKIISSLEQEKENLNEKYKNRIEKFAATQKEIEQIKNQTQGIRTKQALLDEVAKHRNQQKKVATESENIQKEIAEKKENIQNIKGKITEIKRNLEGDRVKGIVGLIEKYEKNEKEIQKKLKESGFANVEVAEKSLLNLEQKNQLEKEIKDFEKQTTTLETKLTTAQKRIEGKQPPDLEQIEKALETLKQELDTKNKQKIELHNQIEALEKAFKEITDLQHKEQHLQQEAEGIIAMANLAKGENSLNQTFEAFVLAAFLNEVVQFANLRLKVLSQERYELKINEEIDDKRGKGGLDLEVWDKYTNTYRDVKNLSGGETFFTSLALALGLADVATAKAGGRKLDAIFIDEGFGTLDTETLDLAIRTLMNLEGEHRMVGIISHVAELKDRIPNKIEVIKQQNGSQIKMHTASLP